SSLQRQRSRSTRSLTSRHKTEATSATKLTMKVTAQPARICRMGLRQTCAKTTSRSAIRSSRHLEGANITAVSSKAAPVHMDSDRTIEGFIPAFWRELGRHSARREREVVEPLTPRLLVDDVVSLKEAAI